ncbi:MAG: hypothetical protein P8X96_25655 [Desulfobacteraceae bacterium]
MISAVITLLLNYCEWQENTCSFPMASRADPVTPGQKNGLFTDFESLNTRPKKKLQFRLKKMRIAGCLSDHDGEGPPQG